MAITESQPGIKVEIISNDTTLLEYDDNDEEGARDEVTKYIEAVSGAEFRVFCTLTTPQPETDLLIQLHIDGKRITGKFFRVSDHRFPSASVDIRDVYHTVGKDWYASNFCFSSLTIDDSDLAPINDQSVKAIKQIGKITVKVFAIKNLRRCEQGSGSLKLGDVGVVPEKALKGRALSHAVSLRGSKRKEYGRQRSNYDHVDASKNPLSTYNFLYRSRDALKALLIIPRSPSPVPLEDRDIDTLNAEEMRELLRQQKQRGEQARNVKVEGVKRERTSDGALTRHADDDVAFVSEKRSRLNITVSETGVETIDLT